MMMQRRALIQTGLGLGLCSLGVGHAKTDALHWRDIVFSGLGTVLSIRAAHARESTLMHALERAKKVVARVEDEMSLFRPNSALCRLNAQGVLHQPSSELFEVLHMSQHIASRSGGAFDVTVQPLWRLYAQVQKEGRLPSSSEVARARQNVGWWNLKVKPSLISFSASEMGVSLNGIAQGYAADAVRASLLRDGVAHALINTGEWASIGSAQGPRPWTLAIADPHRADQWLTRVAMNGWSVATSADDQCTFSDDRVHHHIFDPHTGYSPLDISSVTVAAPSCALADALTKVFFVRGYEQVIPLANAWRVKALVVHKNGSWRATDSDWLPV